MSENEEIKNEKHVCNCEKKELCRFLLTILGSFLGCLVALCLFGAVNKPQPPVPFMPPRFETPAHPIVDCPCMRHRGEFRPDRFHHPDRPPMPPVRKEAKR